MHECDLGALQTEERVSSWKNNRDNQSKYDRQLKWEAEVVQYVEYVYCETSTHGNAGLSGNTFHNPLSVLSNSFFDRISPPYNSGHIPSTQSLVCPTTSPVNCLLLNQLCLYSHSVDSIMETQKCTPNISVPYSVVCHCCSCHHCCVTAIVLFSIVPGCI